MPHRHPASTPSASHDKSSYARRVLRLALGFIAVVLVIDGLVGQQGLIETWRASRKREAVSAATAQLRRENARLREEARRLREEAAAIEEIARRDLGLLKPGELLFILKDVPRQPE